MERDPNQLSQSDLSTPPPVPSSSVYWVRGEDDSVYGPVTLAELREWVSEDRVGPGTGIRRGSEEWSHWEFYPELVALLAKESEAIAPLSKRFFAFLIDYSILTMVISLAFLYVHGDLEIFQNEVQSWREMMQRIQDPVYAELSLFMKLLMEMAHLIYFGYFLSRPHQTLGKKWMGIRVLDAEGRPLLMARAWLRALSSILSLQFFWLGYWITFLNPKRRALHDWLAQTLVFSVSQKNKK